MTPEDDQVQQWDQYWRQQQTSKQLYGVIASFYRRAIIAPSLRRKLSPFMGKGASALHVGAGSGEIDILLPKDWNVTPIDFSSEAIARHRRRFASDNRVSSAIQADMFALPFDEGTFDVCFNLGVMEHFDDDDVLNALRELRRVTAHGGHIVLYWPPVWGPTVLVLHSIAAVLNLFGRTKTQLHPPEINLFRSRSHCRQLLAKAGLSVEKFSYGPGDLFTHMIVVARPV